MKSHDSVAALADALASGGILRRRSARSGASMSLPNETKVAYARFRMDGGRVRLSEDGAIERLRAVDLASVNL
jgi:hypothetical protein